MRGIRWATAAVAAVLLGAGVTAPAQAAGPELEVVRISAAAGIVAGNPVWPQRPVRWTVRVAVRPAGTRLVTQLLRSGRWTTVPTYSRRVSGASVSGSYFPVVGRFLYRVALVDRTGRVVTAPRGWVTTGLRTYGLSRVVSEAPGAVSLPRVVVGEQTYPALWRITSALDESTARSMSVLVPRGRCRAVRVAVSLRNDGVAGSVIEAGADVQHQDSVDTITWAALRATATAPGATSAALPVRSAVSMGEFVIKPQARVLFRAVPVADTWTDGTALLGGVALCSSAVR